MQQAAFLVYSPCLYGTILTLRPSIFSAGAQLQELDETKQCQYWQLPYFVFSSLTRCSSMSYLLDASQTAHWSLNYKVFLWHYLPPWSLDTSQGSSNLYSGKSHELKERYYPRFKGKILAQAPPPSWQPKLLVKHHRYWHCVLEAPFPWQIPLAEENPCQSSQSRSI